MVVTVIEEPKMRAEHLKNGEYKRVDVPKSELGELSTIWSLLPRIGADEGRPSPSAIPVAFKKEVDGKWHFLGIVKYEVELHDLSKSARLLTELLPGRVKVEAPTNLGDVTKYDLEVAVLPEPLKTKMYEAVLKHAGADGEMMVKD